MGAPLPGQIWRLTELTEDMGRFSTLIGDYAARPGTPKSESISLHIFRLPAGEDDEQHPHREDKLYYVLSGRRTLVIDHPDGVSERTPVGPGDAIWIPAKARHRFDGSHEMVLLVVFTPSFTG
ncbi:MAG: cupin domain-containing protein [Pseudomonadota bacterium]